MKMTPVAIVAGSLLILIAVVLVVVILPYADTNKTIPSDLFRARTTLEAEGRDIIHLEMGEPDFATPAHVREACRAALDAGHTGYSPAAGLPALRQAVAERMKTTRGIEVTPEQVVSAFARYVKGKPYVMTSFVPKGAEEQIVEGAERAAIVEEKIVQGAETTLAADPDFEYPRTETSFDRSVPPALGPAPLVRAPAVWDARTANGIRVLGIEHRELPLVEFDLRIRGGLLLDADGLLSDRGHQFLGHGVQLLDRLPHTLNRPLAIPDGLLQFRLFLFDFLEH